MAERYPPAASSVAYPILGSAVGGALVAGTAVTSYPNVTGGAANYPSGSINFATLVTSVTVLQSVQSDLGVTLNGSTVSAWADQSAGAKHYTQATPGNQPLYVASGLNGRPTIRFDGSTSFMSSSLNLAAPATTNTFIYMVVDQVSTTANRTLVSATSASGILLQQKTSPTIAMFSGVAGSSSSGGPGIGSWGRLRALFSGSASDYIKFGSGAQVTGASAGNTTGTGRLLGCQNPGNTAFCNIEVALVMYIQGAPNAGELAALDAAVTQMYGSGVAV